MNTTYLILLILLIIYIPFYIYVRKGPAMKERGIVPYGPFVMFKTKRGIQYLDKAAKYKRFWRVFGTISKVMALFLMIMILFIIIIDLILLPRMMDASGIGVEYALALPGINPMLPLVYGVIGLVVAVAIHEIAHGIQTRANDMAVESTGVLYAVVPVGAFVEPNEEQIKKAPRKARTDMFAAGIAVNLTAAIILFAAMSFGVMGSVSSDFGDRAAVANVHAGSPAADSGMVYSSLIWGIQTDPSDPATFIPMTYDDLMGHGFSPGDEYLIRYATADNEMNTASVHMGVFISGIAKGSPAESASPAVPSDPAGIPKNSILVSIEHGSVTYPIGKIDDFKWLLEPENPSRLRPGDAVTVTVLPYKDKAVGTPKEYHLTLGNNGGRAFFGVNYSISGFSFTTPDDVLSGARNPFHNVDSVTDAPSAALTYIGKPFSGYSPVPQEVQWWYHSSVLSDSALWIVIQTLFWIFWLNLVLAVTNALPAVPFDGGYLFRDGIGAIVDRTHKNAAPEKKEKITNAVASTVSYIMLFALMLVMVVMIF